MVPSSLPVLGRFRSPGGARLGGQEPRAKCQDIFEQSAFMGVARAMKGNPSYPSLLAVEQHRPWLRLRSPVVVLLLVAAAGCSATSPTGSPADVCGTGTELYPTAANAVAKMSADLPEGRPPFAVSLVPTVPVPVRLGDRLGFKLSSGSAGYASLYLIDPVYSVQVLAENLPLAAGSVDYPSSSESFTLRADEPVGMNRAILLVTRQPFDGFSGHDTLTAPVSTALNGRRFVSELNTATRTMAPSSWAADEVCVRIVG